MNELLQALIEATLGGSAATLLVLMLRRPLRARFGAVAAYALWCCVPVALLAVMLPAASVDAPVAEVSWAAPLQAAIAAVPARSPRVADTPWWLALWATGAMAMLALLGWRQRGFVRGLGRLHRRADGCWQAQVDAGLPAVIGVLRPRIVLPAGFDARYLPAEQALILRHERLHVLRGDLQLNAIAAVLHCLAWFNPLAWIALRRFRLDQELACDARVLAGDPASRRRYGETLLKTQLDAGLVPLGCHWQPTHPLKERIAMLKHPAPRRSARLAACALVAIVALGSGFAAWALQPGDARAQARAGDASAGLYQVDVHLDVDGHARRFSLREYAGRPFGFRSEEGGSTWAIEMQVSPEPDPTLVRIRAELQADGKPLSTPVLVAKLDEKATIQIGTPDGGSVFTLDMTVSRLSGAATAATLKPGSGEPPRYPLRAIASGASGEVLVAIDVDAEGAATGVRVERSQPEGLFDAVALEAARQWRFEPARDADGQAVAGQVQVPVTFKLDASAATEAGGSVEGPAMRWFVLASEAPDGKEDCDALRREGDTQYCGVRVGSARQ